MSETLRSPLTFETIIGLAHAQADRYEDALRLLGQSERDRIVRIGEEYLRHLSLRTPEGVSQFYLDQIRTRQRDNGIKALAFVLDLEGNDQMQTRLAVACAGEGERVSLRVEHKPLLEQYTADSFPILDPLARSIIYRTNREPRILMKDILGFSAQIQLANVTMSFSPNGRRAFPS